MSALVKQYAQVIKSSFTQWLRTAYVENQLINEGYFEQMAFEGIDLSHRKKELINEFSNSALEESLIQSHERNIELVSKVSEVIKPLIQVYSIASYFLLKEQISESTYNKVLKQEYKRVKKQVNDKRIKGLVKRSYDHLTNPKRQSEVKQLLKLSTEVDLIESFTQESLSNKLIREEDYSNIDVDYKPRKNKLWKYLLFGVSLTALMGNYLISIAHAQQTGSKRYILKTYDEDGLPGNEIARLYSYDGTGNLCELNDSDLNLILEYEYIVDPDHNPSTNDYEWHTTYSITGSSGVIREVIDGTGTNSTTTTFKNIPKLEGIQVKSDFGLSGIEKTAVLNGDYCYQNGEFNFLLNYVADVGCGIELEKYLNECTSGTGGSAGGTNDKGTNSTSNDKPNESNPFLELPEWLDDLFYTIIGVTAGSGLIYGLTKGRKNKSKPEKIEEEDDELINESVDFIL